MILQEIKKNDNNLLVNLIKKKIFHVFYYIKKSAKY